MFLCKKFILIVLKLDFYDLLFEIYNVISIGCIVFIFISWSVVFLGIVFIIVMFFGVF